MQLSWNRLRPDQLTFRLHLRWQTCRPGIIFKRFFDSFSSCLLLVQISWKFLSCGLYMRLLLIGTVLRFTLIYSKYLQWFPFIERDFSKYGTNFKSESGSWSSAQDVSSIRSGLPRVSRCQYIGKCWSESWSFGQVFSPFFLIITPPLIVKPSGTCSFY